MAGRRDSFRQLCTAENCLMFSQNKYCITSMIFHQMEYNHWRKEFSIPGSKCVIPVHGCLVCCRESEAKASLLFSQGCWSICCCDITSIRKYCFIIVYYNSFIIVISTPTKWNRHSHFAFCSGETDLSNPTGFKINIH